MPAAFGLWSSDQQQISLNNIFLHLYDQMSHGSSSLKQASASMLLPEGESLCACKSSNVFRLLLPRLCRPSDRTQLCRRLLPVPPMRW